MRRAGELQDGTAALHAGPLRSFVTAAPPLCGVVADGATATQGSFLGTKRCEADARHRALHGTCTVFKPCQSADAEIIEPDMSMPCGFPTAIPAVAPNW